jgi:signal transduction histidine kinase
MLNFFYTFRGKLLVILAALLVITLGIQYYLNFLNERENLQLRELQGQALVSGITLGFNAITSPDRVRDIISREGQPYFDAETNRRVKDIIVVNQNWEIYDALNRDYLPTEDANGDPIYKKLADLENLPPLMDTTRLAAVRDKFPNPRPADASTGAVADAEAHAIPVETDQGTWHVMVVLKVDTEQSARRIWQPLLYLLGILLISTLFTVYLVWRFTRPIVNLSDAAREVAEGNLQIRLPETGSGDEVNLLTARFNEMTARLEKNRELESQLQQAEKSAVVGRLASAIAHEIRNPLNYINLTLDHMRAKFVPNEAEKKEQFEKLTAQLKAEVGRINQQVTDFLRYSRPLKLNLAAIDIGGTVEDSLRIVAAQAAEQRIVTEVKAGENTSPALADKEILRSVFNNLFINAVQAMPDGGELKIFISNESRCPESEETGKANNSGDCVKIEVSDTGVGIAPENLDSIFEPYFSTKETGTGLGLAIVKRIVDEHKGAIAVESTLNRGTKFTVRLPAATD